jgi:mono/diheme cytochrome c family protein
VWFADGSELGVLEGDRARETHGAKLSPGAALVGSPGGDVWALAGGALARYAVAEGASWEETIAPVFRRACAGCHRDGGEAGVDLSSGAAWAARRAQIKRRVLEERTMPPPGVTLSDAEREAIRAFVE